MKKKNKRFFYRLFKKIKKEIKKIKKIFLKLSKFVFVKIFRNLISIDNKKIMFITFQGSFTCNLKPIVEELIRKKLDYKLVWVARKENYDNLDQFPPQVKVVKRDSFKFYLAALSSKIWIDNALNIPYLFLKKRKEQIIIQTWHGSMGLKKMDANVVSDKRWVKKAEKYGQETDYCVSNSVFENEVFRGSYWPESKILEYGHPRNDILFNKSKKCFKKIKSEIREQFSLKEDTKIFLYAPTFRTKTKDKIYQIKYNLLLKALESKFGGDWVVLIKLHFKIRNRKDLIPFNKKVINASHYADIQDLIFVSDIALTDYSSWICDWVLTKKPGFLYTPDINKYNKERGFYYSLSETPFPISKTANELIENIMNFDSKIYESKRKKFLKLRGCWEDGEATKRVVEKIEKLLK